MDRPEDKNSPCIMMAIRAISRLLLIRVDGDESPGKRRVCVFGPVLRGFEPQVLPSRRARAGLRRRD